MENSHVRCFKTSWTFLVGCCMSTSHCRAKLGNKRVRAALFMDRITSSNLTLPRTAAGKLSKSVLHGIGPCSGQQRAWVFCSASYGRSSSIGASMKRGFYHSCTATEFLGKNLVNPGMVRNQHVHGWVN
jgi:hypothetical protein